MDVPALDSLILGFEWYIVFLFSTVCHEAAHALASMKLGDRTAYYGGQVSLDPLPHVRREPIGMVVVPILSFFLNDYRWMMGWASAPYDPLWAARHPKRAAMMALAGPLANLLLVIVAALIIRAGLLLGVFSIPGRGQFDFTSVVMARDDGAIARGATILVSILFVLNLALFVFNLLPLPPLDGSSLPPLFMSEATAERYQNAVRSPGFALLGLFAAWQVFPVMFGPVLGSALRVLYLG